MLFALYVALCALSLTWPGYAWLGSGVEPFVLGLPFGFAWNVGWSVATFAALVLYEAARRRMGD